MRELQIICANINKEDEEEAGQNIDLGRCDSIMESRSHGVKEIFA